MNAPLFRPEALQAHRERLGGTVIAATPPRSAIYVWAVVIVAVLGALVLTFGEYAPRAQVKGMIAYDAGIARVHPNAPGEVRAIQVREGQEVRAGDPLATIAFAQGSGGMAQQLAELDAQDKQMAEQQRLAGELAAAEIATLERQRQNLSASVGSLERQRSLAAGQAALAESENRRARSLAAQGAGSQRQVEESRSAALAARAQAEGLTERIIQQQGAMREAEGRIAQRRLEAERSRAELGAQRAALAEQRGGLARQDSIVLTAPVNGRVEQIALTAGQRATPDTPIMTIVPSGGRMEAWLYAPTSGAGFVRPGQSVSLLFDAFPHQLYGAGQGTVVEVARMPVQGATLDKQLALDEPVFKVRVSIDTLPDAARRGERLRAGMTLVANIELERRSLWELLFNPFASALR
jgi:membrane fusion protein